MKQFILVNGTKQKIAAAAAGYFDVHELPLIETVNGIGVDVGSLTDSDARGLLKALSHAGLVRAAEFAAWRTELEAAGSWQ